VSSSWRPGYLPGLIHPAINSHTGLLAVCDARIEGFRGVPLLACPAVPTTSGLQALGFRSPADFPWL